MTIRFSYWSCVLTLLAFGSLSKSADPTYWQDVRPVLRKHCTVCHSEKNLKETDVSAGLALDTLEAVKKGGKKPVVVMGKGVESPIVAILRHPKPSRRMPLDADPLPDATVALLANWIDVGMPEGMKPVEMDSPATPSTPRKRTDIAVATRPLPKNVAKPGQTTALEVVATIGPLAPVTAVAFSGDGRYAASGAYGRVVVWDLKTAKPARVLTNVLGAVNDLKFSPDSSILAVAGGQPSARGDIRLFSIKDWSLTATLGGHVDVVGSVAFSPDGKSLASASFDKTIRVWNLETRQSVLNYTGHSDFVHAVAFGPGGDWIATASKDRTGRLVEIKTGQSRLTFSGTDQEVLAVGIKPDGSTVVTAGVDPVLSWWNSQTGERTKRTPGHGTAVHEICVSQTGDVAASAGGDKTVRLWNTKSMEALRTIAVGSVVYAVALSRDAKLVASGSYDGYVRVYETDAGRLLVTLVGVAENEWLAVTPEGFAAASDAVTKIARWRVGNAAVNADWAWKAAGNSAEVAKALAGNKIREPAFAVPQP